MKKSPVYEYELTDPNAESPAGTGRMGDGLTGRGGRTGLMGPGPAVAEGDESGSHAIKLQRFDFVVQFFWQPTTPQERKAKEAAEKAKEAEEKAKAATQPVNNAVHP